MVRCVCEQALDIDYLENDIWILDIDLVPWALLAQITLE